MQTNGISGATSTPLFSAGKELTLTIEKESKENENNVRKSKNTFNNKKNICKTIYLGNNYSNYDDESIASPPPPTTPNPMHIDLTDDLTGASTNTT